MERKQTTILNKLQRLFSVLMLLIFSLSANAATEVREFDSAQQEQQYHGLIDELRCLVCQNQNLADSNAALAQDLRERTYQMVRGGDSSDEIIDYMVARYGEFIMYRPPLRTSTYLLWFGPLVFLLLAVLTVVLYWRRTRRNTEVKLDAASRQKVRNLLDD
ncbi:MAG: cytochrome c-type biogenesis protein CcmH [Gammaproteobacteria bacterium]|nr:cytochrome c-type biogenesis protein CcmH [Gammaproteobacteria bacterium]